MTVTVGGVSIMAPLAGSLPTSGRILERFHATPLLLGLDVETRGLTDTTCRTVQMGTTSEAWVWDVADPAQRDFVGTTFSSGYHRWVSHTKIDPVVVHQTYGLNVSPHCYDTWTNACLLEPGEVVNHALKPLTVRQLGDSTLHDASQALDTEFARLRGPRPKKPPKPTKPKSTKPEAQARYLSKLQAYDYALTQWAADLSAWEAWLGWAHIPSDNPIYTTYGGLDASYALRLFYKQLELLQDKGITRDVILAEQRFYQICLDMRIRGMKVDRTYARDVALGEHERTYESFREEFEALTGFVSGSPKLGPFLEERGVTFTVFSSKTDAPSLKKVELERAHSRYLSVTEPDPVAVRAMELKEGIAGVTNYVTFTRKVLELTGPDDRIHSDFKNLGAETGRMSAVEPAVQTVKGAVTRGIILPYEPDEVLVSIDMSQIEPRIAAAEAGETRLIDKIMEGWDVYDAAATMTWGSAFTPKQRKGMKRTILATLYAGGVGVIQTQLRVLDGIVMSEEEVQEIREMWWDIAPNIRKMSWRLAREPEAIWLPSGRFVPQYKGREYKGLNSLVQGTARDVLRDSTFRVYDAGYGDRLINLIHDEGVFSLKRATLDHDVAILRGCFEVPYKGVPVVTEVEVYEGGRWGHGTRVLEAS